MSRYQSQKPQYQRPLSERFRLAAGIAATVLAIGLGGVVFYVIVLLVIGLDEAVPYAIKANGPTDIPACDSHKGSKVMAARCIGQTWIFYARQFDPDTAFIWEDCARDAEAEAKKNDAKGVSQEDHDLAITHLAEFCRHTSEDVHPHAVEYRRVRAQQVAAFAAWRANQLETICRWVSFGSHYCDALQRAGQPPAERASIDLGAAQPRN